MLMKKSENDERGGGGGSSSEKAMQKIENLNHCIFFLAVDKDHKKGCPCQTLYIAIQL